MATHAVIMAGGAGTRFWPASRKGSPKQLLPLGDDPTEPLLAATVRRLAPLIPADRVTVVTGVALAASTAAALPGVPRDQILAEPAPRNTAPCIGWATATILRKDPDALIAVLPSDHHIGDEARFRAVLAQALAAAEGGFIATVGIVPTRAETGYGYIEVGAPIEGEASHVHRFVEKPDAARANAFLAGGKHLWNAGMFLFRGRQMMQAIERHLPDLAKGLAMLDRAAEKDDEAKVLGVVFPMLPSISIDHGVIEKATGLAVVRGDFGWSDVGSWESAWDLATKDGAGNALPERAVAIDATNNFVRDLSAQRKPRVYALVGVRDLVVVETDDAVLIIPRSRAQDVRSVVEALKSRGDENVL